MHYMRTFVFGVLLVCICCIYSPLFLSYNLYHVILPVCAIVQSRQMDWLFKFALDWDAHMYSRNQAVNACQSVSFINTQKQYQNNDGGHDKMTIKDCTQQIFVSVAGLLFNPWNVTGVNMSLHLKEMSCAFSQISTVRIDLLWHIYSQNVTNMGNMIMIKKFSAVFQLQKCCRIARDLKMI